MSKRVVLHVYEEDRLTGEKQLKYSDVVVTELTASEIVDFLQVDNGFSACIVEGRVLSFLDCSCIVLPVDVVVNRLKKLPISKDVPEVVIPDRCILTVTAQSNEEALARSGQELVYVCERVECGASGFSELIIEAGKWASNHPWAMVFVGGFLWDWTKKLCDLLRRWLGSTVRPKEGHAPIAFSPKKFHKNLAGLLDLGAHDFQIIKIGREKRGEHKVIIRTIKDETYEIAANTKGRIISVKQRH